FPAVTLTFPIDWRINPYKSSGWCHHFMSLRWISPNREDSFIITILRSFFNFHCEKLIKNPYYNKMRGDHAATRRIKQVLAFKEKFQKKGNHPGVALCDQIIIRDIENLQKPDMYRAG